MILCQGFLLDKEYHSKLVGSEHFLKRFMSCSTDDVRFTAKTSLYLQVQTHIAEK